MTACPLWLQLARRPAPTSGQKYLTDDTASFFVFAEKSDTPDAGTALTFAPIAAPILHRPDRLEPRGQMNCE